MSKQSKSTKSESKETKEVKQAVVATPAPVAAPVVEEPQKVSRKKKVAAEAAPVAAPAPVVAAPAAEESSSEEAAEVSNKRRQVTREDVEKAFDSVLLSIEEEIDLLRKNEDKTKAKGVRFLRSVAKSVRQLRSDSLRVSSKKVRRTTTSSCNSGFMKPVKISKDMQKFTGLNEDQLVSRVDVTKSICQYVKTNSLQNEADRRQFTPDEKLAKLLGTDKSMTYYALQQHIQPHFIKEAK